MANMSRLLERTYDFREKLVQQLRKDLLGPRTADEILNEADKPLSKYITGVLWPEPDNTTRQNHGESVVEDPNSAESGPEDGYVDSPIATSRMSTPSTCGMTFTVDPDEAPFVYFSVQAASYEKTPWLELPDTRRSEFVDTEASYWVRHPIALRRIEVSTSAGSIQPKKFDVVPEKLQLYVVVRPRDKHGLVTLTVVLRNLQARKPSGDLADPLAWFQVQIAAETNAPAIVDRRTYESGVSKDRDLASSQLLYRDVWNFGSGHGSSVDWDRDAAVSGKIGRVCTTFIPRAEVARAEPGDTTANLSLAHLTSAPDNVVIRELEVLCDQYEQWITDRRKEIPAVVPLHLHEKSIEHLDSASEALVRMRSGIKLLANDDLAFQAFRLANKAMHLQRSRQDWVRNDSSGDFSLTDQKWRPFQLAFVLVNLPSLSDRKHPEREIADLLWFPAGGGKTEAYLALVAYLIILRRLRDSDVEGTAVIMRYTLRLLTAQQFERASMLICALDVLRRESPELLGLRPFGIGLWVGKKSTPNTLKEARSNLRKLGNGDVVEEGNPMQLQNCPWCGQKLDIDSFSVQDLRGLRMVCKRSSCEFSSSDGLPVYVVDEDIYRVRPELVIGTVDKFASMAWRSEVAALFGRTHRSDIGPDLIIQDELHLISGPLGSTVGIYETAVDWAASRSNGDGSISRPKIVASTATIRRAEEQIRSVFDRGSRLFPPPGLNPDDSFFARPAAREKLGTREYIGVMAPATSQATLMVRTYASLLHTVFANSETPDEIRDVYWTLVGYFNSLRVLGSAYLQVQDDIDAERLRLLAALDGLESSRSVDFEELTSRRPSSEIPRTLKRLESGLGGDEKPLDVVLATNMISVGLDVDRLGLMAVMGQPPSSAEYIQATSRVGRKHPGLVVTMFNASKSRDRSHYEGFADFHGSLYRAVEATSATPFAARSRDKSLSGVLVSAVRMSIDQLRENNTAGLFSARNEEVEQVKIEILRRARSVVGEDDTKTFTAVESDLAARIRTWWEQAESEFGVRDYVATSSQAKTNDRTPLIQSASKALANEEGPTPHTELPWKLGQSMRDVDAETGLNVILPRSSRTHRDGDR
jgi:hypothetical protein